MDKQEITERIRQYRQEIDAAKAQWNQEYAASSDEERTAMQDYAEFCAYMEEREVEAIDEEYAEELTGAGDIVRIKPELLGNSELQQMRYMLAGREQRSPHPSFRDRAEQPSDNHRRHGLGRKSRIPGNVRPGIKARPTAPARNPPKVPGSSSPFRVHPSQSSGVILVAFSQLSLQHAHNRRCTPCRTLLKGYC